MGLGEIMSKYDILPRMIKDHCKIENLINDLEENIDANRSKIIDLFNKFEWVLEKHIFIEEKAIFLSYRPEDVNEGYKMLPELTKQHNEILNRLDIIRREVHTRGVINDVYGLKQFIIKHKNYEEKEVYPKLDMALNDDQKKDIIDKIEQIIGQ